MSERAEPPGSIGKPGAADMAAQWPRIFEALGSLRFTLVCLGLLLGALWWVYDRSGEVAVSVSLALPLGLLSINLIAALIFNKAFRRQLPLMVFHVALLAVIILAALGRLTYLRATSEVVTGSEFSSLDRIEAGPWHRGAKDALRFENLGFRVEYRPGLKRDATINKVRWWDEAGLPHVAEIGDQVPLVVRGYRFYTSSNKGFSALFRWEPDGEKPEVGSVNFPSYPANIDRQTAGWNLGRESIQVKLNIREQLINPTVAAEFRMPGDHDVTLDFSWRVVTLRPGEGIRLPTGKLSYLGLSTWMGYDVFYDWTMPWLLAACSVAVLALGAHFVSKFMAKPWRP